MMAAMKLKYTSISKYILESLLFLKEIYISPPIPFMLEDVLAPKAL